ncbi:MAG: coenzyme F420-0:L-glutamate ligase/coenzyme F420-1:gamma-L-glutamate ligase, partial [Glaciecola sp.]
MVRFEVIPLPLDGEMREGQDIAGALLASASQAGITLEDGDVVCVASKVIAKSQGAWIDLQLGPDPSSDELREARRAAARARAARIVADTPFVLITQTHHGFVCANGGIDASNVPDARGLDLPEDCDRSASELRAQLRDVTGREVGVVVTDTFGRPWREGQVDVALGVAGVAAMRDERGTTDRLGRTLEVTIVALADQLAAAADLARSKSDGTPFVVIRGLGDAVAGDGTGRELVRDGATDLFRHGGPQAVEAGVIGRRTVRSFSPEPVAIDLLARAVAAAATAPAPHHTRPWRFIRLTTATREVLLDAMARQWRKDLVADGLPAQRIDDRVTRSHAILRQAP